MTAKIRRFYENRKSKRLRFAAWAKRNHGQLNARLLQNVGPGEAKDDGKKETARTALLDYWETLTPAQKEWRLENRNFHARNNPG